MGRNNTSRKIKKIISHDIEPEDLFLDRAVHMNADVPHDSKVEWEFSLSRLRLFVFVFGIFTILLAARGAYLGVLKFHAYQALSYSNASRAYVVPAPRGIIYDRNGTPLTENIPSFNLVALPKDLEAMKGSRDALVDILVGNGDEAAKEFIRERLSSLDFSSPLETVLLGDLTFADALSLKSSISGVHGLRLDVSALRKYPNTFGLSHVLGYTGKVSRTDLASNKGFSLGDILGKTGVEYTYDSWLRGKNGKRKTEVDSQLNIRREGVVQDPEAGNDLVLSIDLPMQEKLFTAFQTALRTLKIKSGAGIAMDPKSGEILALVSFPDYDNNAFVETNASEIKKILNDSNNPLFNRAVSGEYLPGSSIKPLLASGALEEGIVDEKTKINSANDILVVNQYDPSVVYRFKDTADYGLVSIKRALAVSSNIYFYTIGGGNATGTNIFHGLGVEKMKDYFRAFGLGSTLGIDLPQESSGRVPDPAWKERVKKEKWLLGDTYNMSIGQGDISLTPLQLVASVSSIANGGTLYRPHVGLRLRDKDNTIVKEFGPEAIGNNGITEDNLKLVREGMKESIEYGTASLLSHMSGKVAAKTGTAQFNGMLRTWFTGFAPLDHPDVVVTILLEGGTGGGASAGPIAKDFFEWYLGRSNTTIDSTALRY